MHLHIDVDVLQPIFRGLNYGKQTIGEIGWRNRHDTIAKKKNEGQSGKEREKGMG